MTSPPPPAWAHSHVFGQDAVQPGERRTRLVLVLTAAMMGIEIAAGSAYGSMALLADGLHMGSHAVALGLATAAYAYARRHAADERFSFGTGKVNALGGFAGAVLLAGFALLMALESIGRLLAPVAIVFDHAILVAVVGLVVNGLSMAILGGHHAHGDDQEHGNDHEHSRPHGHHAHHAHGHGHAQDPGHGHDHTLRSAYLHVAADALTSVLAIAALLAGKYFGANWLDAVMGVVGAILVTRWSVGLLRACARVLLDHQAPAEVRARMAAAIEGPGDARIEDLHVWSVGPDLLAAELVLVAAAPLAPADYKRRLHGTARLVHVTVEVHAATGPDPQVPRPAREG